MKMSTCIVTLLAAAVSIQTVFAAQPQAEQKKQALAQTTETADEYDVLLMQMQKNMQQMQTQMEKIQQSKNPQERQNILHQHWLTMQSSMDLMHDMCYAGRMGCAMNGRGMRHGHGMMRGPMKGWGEMRGYYSKFTPEQQKQHQYMRDQYMMMQQMMMDNMMRHQYWQNQPAPTKK